MDLWLVLVAFGNIGGTWGPLPYDMAECQVRAADMIAEIHAGIAANPGVPLKGKPVTADDIAAFCVEAQTRPVLGSVYQN